MLNNNGLCISAARDAVFRAFSMCRRRKSGNWEQQVGAVNQLALRLLPIAASSNAPVALGGAIPTPRR